MFNWTKFQSPLFGKLILVVIIPILLALVFLGFAFMGPIITSAQEPLPASQISLQTDYPWTIHLYASPASPSPTIPPTGDRGLYAFAGKTTTRCKNGKVTFNAKFLGVPTAFEGIYNSDANLYSGFLDIFFDPVTNTQVGELQVVCDLPDGDKLVAGPITFWRYYYTPTQTIEVPSAGSNAILTLFPNGLTAPSYIIVMDANGFPDVLPVGVKAIGLPYSFRASGLIFESNNNMDLVLRYSDSLLGGADRLTLRILEWDAPNDTWADTGDQTLLPSVDPRLNKPTKKFTTYILGSTPRWCDSFTSGIGLEPPNGIRRDAGTLKLEDTATTGTATSKPYTPTLPLRAWQSISYTTANTSAGRSLSVSVLSQDNQVLKANVHSGQSLSGLLHPSLKLKVEMSTTSPGNSPQLLEWCLLADVTDEVYLPIVIKG